MFKLGKSLYPKTTRVGMDNKLTVLTEKLDGSNLGFYVQEGKLYIAQRNWIFCLEDLEEAQEFLYKGLYQFLKQNGEFLQSNIYAGSIMFGEWIGMGQLKYDLPHRFYIFAKGRIDSELSITNLVYKVEYLKYVFNLQEIPSFMDTVPLVIELEKYPETVDLDNIYDMYTAKVGRNVEGFVINRNEQIRKYVRMKSGKLTPHTTRGD